MFLSPIQHGIMNSIKTTGVFVPHEHTAHEAAEILELVQAKVITKVDGKEAYKDARNEN